MRRFLMTLMVVALLCSCGSADKTQGPGASAVKPAALPTSTQLSPGDCTARVTAIGRADNNLDFHTIMALEVCETVGMWTRVLALYPKVSGIEKGADLPVSLLGDVCSGRDDVCSGRDEASVCADAIGQGLFQATGNDRMFSELPQAAIQCEREDDLQDNGMSLTLRTSGKKNYQGVQFKDVMCIADYLDIPDFVVKHIESTRALDGQREDDWANIKARWTYHPDNGLGITFIQL